MTIPTSKELLKIRGRAEIGKVSSNDLEKIFAYIDYLEEKLDESDSNDTFGTEGWRHYFELDED